MSSRQRVSLTSGAIAAIASFFIWRALGDDFAFALTYAVVVGVVAAGLSWWQYRSRD